MCLKMIQIHSVAEKGHSIAICAQWNSAMVQCCNGTVLQWKSAMEVRHA